MLNYGESDRDIVVIERVEVFKEVPENVKHDGVPVYGQRKKVKKTQVNIDPSASNRRPAQVEEEKKQSSPVREVSAQHQEELRNLVSQFSNTV